MLWEKYFILIECVFSLSAVLLEITLLCVERSGDPESAIAKTVETGISYCDGNPLIPSADLTNEYDNYMVLRGALWASENFQLTKQKRIIERNIGTREIEQVMTIYKFASDRRLKGPVDAEALAEYGAWLE